jgi:hypothetical protein
MELEADEMFRLVKMKMTQWSGKLTPLNQVKDFGTKAKKGAAAGEKEIKPEDVFVNTTPEG